eukprot:GFYU01003368.1.p1 GENE.GFYU01003368.1~~GFYU01003368.1.p1  ORF type:complete len:440 (-),score=91.75 GFYU01003368.1:87-1406(-)
MPPRKQGRTQRFVEDDQSQCSNNSCPYRTEVSQLRSENMRLQANQNRQRRGTIRYRALQPAVFAVDGDNLQVRRQTLARHASIDTRSVLDSLPVMEADQLATRLVDNLNVWDDPMIQQYLNADGFRMDMLQLCDMVMPYFERESRLLSVTSPCYVFGDLHGNMKDLSFFSLNLWTFGMDLTAGRFLFLGDYVDRGIQGLEVCAYLFASKMIVPDKVLMLRGNHELRDVNGNEDHYGEGSFLTQCKAKYGEAAGTELWEKVNQVFDRLPLAAIIDEDIFCGHGGFPRSAPGYPDRLAAIRSVPCPASIEPAGDNEPPELCQAASDILWSDPGDVEWDYDPDGFGQSPRGGDAICFGTKAVEDFLTEHSLSYVMRAHQANAQGVSLTNAARVFTVFSTSQNHGLGKYATCGCVLVDRARIVAINRLPRDGMHDASDDEMEG